MENVLVLTRCCSSNIWQQQRRWQCRL